MRLQEALVEKFAAAATLPETRIRLEGKDDSWSCIAERGSSTCDIWCCEREGQPRYDIRFQRGGEKLRIGNGDTEQRTIAAVADWLNGCDAPALRERHSILNPMNRALLGLRAKLMEARPSLSLPPYLFAPFAGPFDALVLRQGERTCSLWWISSHEKKNPHAEFFWDGCRLFKFEVTDIQFLAAVTNRWLVDTAKPSEMKVEFPSLNIHPVAEYYEIGNGLEGEFFLGWDAMENSWVGHLPESIQPLVKAFIAAMRQKGYDRKLRPGQSMFTFVLSRSRRYGLRQGQPFVDFSFNDEGMTISNNLGGTCTTHQQPSIMLTPEVEQLLERLAAEPID
ncbi:hypothetical protein [Roseimicrobium sp. ORNL1]|uniref:hypothetical protein n=1 Tax=Roseimicrobium sp. ORNL1 TaxID=2711231 RepID=UPI0013E197D9|nr:hypothetical protein [Roseimicrobium sp. ORNL1]QIE99984.1 hypothetical protein G5S37_00070 [Roseimicrobium sp. ORNL1]